MLLVGVDLVGAEVVLWVELNRSRGADTGNASILVWCLSGCKLMGCWSRALAERGALTRFQPKESRNRATGAVILVRPVGLGPKGAGRPLLMMEKIGQRSVSSRG